MYIYILIGIVVLIILYALVQYNNFAKLNNSVKESFSTIDIYLKNNGI